MTRKFNVKAESKKFNPWIRKSIRLFELKPYLDLIYKIYPFELSPRKEITPDLRRKIIQFHKDRDTPKLIEALESLNRFPYEDSVWYILRTIKGCFDRNPLQVARIAKNLYSMTAEETLTRLEAPPELNTQTGPMFRAWLMKKFQPVSLEKFDASRNEIVVLDVSEQEGKEYIQNLGQSVIKRPDLICKAGTQIIIGEAKWVGQPGGNQFKQVGEVLDFCRQQRGNVRRVGIVDGFPWAVYNKKGKIISNKEAVGIQESEYDIFSALLLEEYVKQFYKPRRTS